jgi:pimeloyl-ACP methyl ester carboxylesterase
VSSLFFLLATVGVYSLISGVLRPAGKFQMDVVNDAGHLVHEDKPEETAQILAAFLSRLRPVVVPKPT